MELVDKGCMYDDVPATTILSTIRVRVIGEENTISGERTIYLEQEQMMEAFNGMFDISGRRLSAPQSGINIINGKKTMLL